MRSARCACDVCPTGKTAKWENPRPRHHRDKGCVVSWRVTARAQETTGERKSAGERPGMGSTSAAVVEGSAARRCRGVAHRVSLSGGLLVGTYLSQFAFSHVIYIETDAGQCRQSTICPRTLPTSQTVHFGQGQVGQGSQACSADLVILLRVRRERTPRFVQRKDGSSRASG